MFRLSKRQEAEADSNDYSLDFGKALAEQLGPSGEAALDSGGLWTPGMEVEGSGEALPQSSTASDEFLTPAARAADELNRFYQTLPDSVHDLTFEDLVEKNKPREEFSKRRDGEAKNGRSDKQSRPYRRRSEKKGVKDNGIWEENGRVRRGSKENGTIKGAKQESDGNLSKITGMLSPKRFSSSKPALPTADELDKLVEKRGRRSPKLEGLYSASTTPTASFRKVSPNSPFESLRSAHTSPTTSFRKVAPDSPLGSVRSSPRTSLSDFMLPIDIHSCERDLSKSSLAFQEEEQLPFGTTSPQRRLLSNTSQNHSPSKRPSRTSECVRCSISNLAVETRCKTCGKCYCKRCAKFATQDTPEGRACLINCERLPGSYSPSDFKQLRKDSQNHATNGSREEAARKQGCFSFLICFQPKPRDNQKVILQG